MIIGGAGSGKTWNLIDKVVLETRKGVPISRIAFVTFSKAAAEEARERLMRRFNCTREDIPLCGTIHSICYKRYCADKKVIKEKHKVQFFKRFNIDYEICRSDDELISNERIMNVTGNMMLNFYDKLRMGLCIDIDDISSNEELRKAFMKMNIQNLDFEDIFAGSFNVFKILKAYQEFLRLNNLVDFPQMLLLAYKDKYIVDADILICDEQQDLSPIQHYIYLLWSQNKKEVYIGGDPNQCIYGFNLANAEYLLNEIRNIDLNNGDEKILLPNTYRMAEKINTYCSDYISNNLRKDKHIHTSIKPIKMGGEIIEEEIDQDLNKILNYIDPNKSTFILTRTNYYKQCIIENLLIPNGIPYSEIKGKSIWSIKYINLFNAIIKLIDKVPLTSEEAGMIFESIPFKFGLMKRGSKVNFKKSNKKDSYTVTDLLQAGFHMSIFDYLNYERIFDILDVPDIVITAFKATKRAPIQMPINLKISTCHGAKGKEADNVIVVKDVSKRISNEISKSIEAFESEIRVFYVGQSRAKEKLVLLRGVFERADKYIIP